MVQDEGPMADAVAKWRKEISKGSLRLALLSLLNEEESYGYQILATLKQRAGGVLQPTEAAVYPLLKDMEKHGYLHSRWRATEDGVPPRKYYALTADGARLLAALRKAWTEYRQGIDELVS